MSDAIVTAARARLAADFPTWTDATGAAHPTPEDRMPAYAVRVTYSESERTGMGEADQIHTGQIEVGLEVLTPANSEAGLHDLAEQMAQAILAPPGDLGALAWDITPGGFEAEHDKGASPISRGDLIMPLQVID